MQLAEFQPNAASMISLVIYLGSPPSSEVLLTKLDMRSDQTLPIFRRSKLAVTPPHISTDIINCSLGRSEYTRAALAGGVGCPGVRE